MIDADFSLLTAFLMGLLGGVHCFGMCGGIVGALSFSLKGASQGLPKTPWALLLSYNLGRIASYSVAGLIAGGLAWFSLELSELHQMRLALMALSGVFMLAMGLYLAGWWFGLAQIEKAGAVLWKKIEPYGRRLMPVNNPLHALGLGALWGWLPCGLVYSALVMALATADPVHGALLMLLFGLGTLPNLLAMGVFAAKLGQFLRQALIRISAGLLVAGFGVLSLYRVFIQL